LVDLWSDAATIGISAHKDHDRSSPTYNEAEKKNFYSGDLRNEKQIHIGIKVQSPKKNYILMFELSLQVKRKVAKKFEVKSERAPVPP
jgi:hypothetical protein